MRADVRAMPGGVCDLEALVEGVRPLHAADVRAVAL